MGIAQLQHPMHARDALICHPMLTHDALDAPPCVHSDVAETQDARLREWSRQRYAHVPQEFREKLADAFAYKTSEADGRRYRRFNTLHCMHAVAPW